MAIYQGLRLIAGSGTSPFIDKDGYWNVAGNKLAQALPVKVTAEEYSDMINNNTLDENIKYEIIDGVPMLYTDVKLSASSWVDGSNNTFSYKITTDKIKTTDLVSIDIANSLSLEDYVTQQTYLQKARIQRIQLTTTGIILHGFGLKPSTDIFVDISAVRTIQTTL